MENWKPIRTEISFFTKADGDHIISLRLVTTEKISEETGEVKWFYRILSPKNPLPVKGEFESSFRVLSNWLRDQGWHRMSGKEIIIHHYH